MTPVSCVLVRTPYPCLPVPIFTWDRRPSDLLVMGTTIVVPIYSFVGAKRGVALPVLAHSSLKLGHLEKCLGFFLAMHDPYLP